MRTVVWGMYCSDSPVCLNVENEFKGVTTGLFPLQTHPYDWKRNISGTFYGFLSGSRGVGEVKLAVAT